MSKTHATSVKGQGSVKKGAARWTLTCSCLLMLGLLTACDAAQWPLGNQQSRPVAHYTANKSASTVKPATKPQTPTKSATASAATTADVMPVATSAPVSSVWDGSGNPALVGLNTEQTKVMLGPPTEEVDHSPAKIWRYRTPQCTLDVALYPDVQTHDFRVLNYEVNGNDGTEQGRRQCIAGLRSGLRTR